jgi:sulfur-carrier protein
MKLRVQYTAQLRAAAGRAEDEIELPEGSSLAELLAHLATKLDGAAAHLLSTDGRTHRSLLIVVNDLAVPAHAAAATSLKPGDIVTLLPPIAGG